MSNVIFIQPVRYKILRHFVNRNIGEVSHAMPIFQVQQRHRFIIKVPLVIDPIFQVTLHEHIILKLRIVKFSVTIGNWDNGTVLGNRDYINNQSFSSSLIKFCTYSTACGASQNWAHHLIPIHACTASSRLLANRWRMVCYILDAYRKNRCMSPLSRFARPYRGRKRPRRDTNYC